MKAQIIQIGNSQGLRIPKVLLEETGLAGEVDIVVHEEGLLIRNLKKPRGDWDAAFNALVDIDDDQRVTATKTDFEKKGWQW